MSKRPMDSDWKTRMSPPLALLTLAALTPPEHEVTVADENIERVRFDDAPGLVGISVKADTFYRACEIARAYRRRGIRVVFGGIHPTLYPNEAHELGAAHAVAFAVGNRPRKHQPFRSAADARVDRLQNQRIFADGR